MGIDGNVVKNDEGSVESEIQKVLWRRKGVVGRTRGLLGLLVAWRLSLVA